MSAVGVSAVMGSNLSLFEMKKRGMLALRTILRTNAARVRVSQSG